MLALYSWLGVHTVSAVEGVGEWQADLARAQDLRAELARLQTRNANLDAEVAALASRGLSLDALDQRARHALYAARDGEIVIPISD